MAIDLTGRVALVTGAGGGLGRSHALALARAGARVVVNDLGSAVDGRGASDAAGRVVAEIQTAGGQAMANGASVTDADAIAALVDEVHDRWGRLDILVNNAGILRDRSFAKMSADEFMAVIQVHILGAYNCTRAVWTGMREREHGRIIMTTSSSGLYGNFGQANYGAAKMALVGLANTLRIEGAKHGIRVNCLAPSAATRMTEGLYDPDQAALLGPEGVSAAVVALAADDAPNGAILCAGGGHVARAHVTLTAGRHVGCGDGAAERILAEMDAISDRMGEIVPEEGWEQSRQEARSARKLAA